MTKFDQILQNLDSLGMGFILASHDLDIRGAGNLLGSKQSGHIKEVGIELYQSLLKSAIEIQTIGESQDSFEWSKYVPNLLDRLMFGNYLI